MTPRHAVRSTIRGLFWTVVAAIGLALAMSPSLITGAS